MTWNPGAQRIYGFTPQEAIGHSFDLIVPPVQQKEYLRLLETVKNGEAIANYITVRKTKQANEVLLSMSISPIKDASRPGRDKSRSSPATLMRLKGPLRLRTSSFSNGNSC